MGSRTKARECALQALYQLDTSGGDARDAVEHAVDERRRLFRSELLPQLDGLVERHANRHVRAPQNLVNRKP